MDAVSLFGNLMPFHYYWSGVVAGKIPEGLSLMGARRPTYARLLADKPGWVADDHPGAAGVVWAGLGGGVDDAGAAANDRAWSVAPALPAERMRRCRSAYELAYGDAVGLGANARGRDHRRAAGLCAAGPVAGRLGLDRVETLCAATGMSLALLPLLLYGRDAGRVALWAGAGV